jgi:phosphate:Na+ symporter
MGCFMEDSIQYPRIMKEIIFLTVGGLGIFLYGMTQLSEGLQKIAGSRLRSVVRAFTSSRIKGIFLGAGVTSIVQSSSVTTIMLVGLLNAGVMNLQQSIGVIYGANIGTTITAQIIAFKITQYALPMVAIGFVFFFFTGNKRTKFIGQIILALGFIFLGLKFMKDAFAPLRSSETVMNFTASLSDHPVLAILCGLILTVIVQSSSASIGVTIAMATTGLIDFTAALYILLGDNIGTTVTAWLASIKGAPTSRRMAIAHSLFNIIGACYFGFLVYTGLYGNFIAWITPGELTMESAARHIANAHTLFNIANAIILFPAIPLLAWIATKLHPVEDEPVFTGEAKFIDDHLMETPEVAVEQLVKEIHHMGLIAKDSFTHACHAFFHKDDKSVKKAKNLEQAVDMLQQDITRYIVKIFSRPLSQDLSNRLPSLLHSVNDLEKISDHAENIAQMSEARKDDPYPVTKQALKEMQSVYEHTIKMFDHTLELLQKGPSALGRKILVEEDTLDKFKKDYIANHVERLKNKQCHPLAGLAFVAFINNAEKIGDHLTNVAQAAVSQFAYDRETTKVASD